MKNNYLTYATHLNFFASNYKLYQLSDFKILKL